MSNMNTWYICKSHGITFALWLANRPLQSPTRLDVAKHFQLNKVFGNPPWLAGPTRPDNRRSRPGRHYSCIMAKFRPNIAMLIRSTFFRNFVIFKPDTRLNPSPLARSNQADQMFRLLVRTCSIKSSTAFIPLLFRRFMNALGLKPVGHILHETWTGFMPNFRTGSSIWRW